MKVICPQHGDYRPGLTCNDRCKTLFKHFYGQPQEAQPSKVRALVSKHLKRKA